VVGQRLSAFKASKSRMLLCLMPLLHCVALRFTVRRCVACCGWASHQLEQHAADASGAKTSLAISASIHVFC